MTLCTHFYSIAYTTANGIYKNRKQMKDLKGERLGVAEIIHRQIFQKPTSKASRIKILRKEDQTPHKE